MKIIKNINYIILSVLLILSSCSKDFLEEEPTGSITKERIAEVVKINPEAAKGGVNGLYNMTFLYKVGGVGGHTDFGQKSFDIASGILCGDIAQTSHSYGHFADVSNLSGLTKTGDYSYKVWYTYYKIIRAANTVIEANEKLPYEQAKYSLGQARAMRAYAYLYLINFFAPPYLDGADKPGVIIHDKNDGIAKGLSTIQEVYNFIEQDLTDALKDLDGFKRSFKFQMNQNVVRGLLTYTYLFEGKYQEAEETSNAVISSNEFTLMSKDEVINSGFNNVDIPGWMWAIDLDLDNTAALPTFWGMMDMWTYGYQSVIGFKINKELWEAIPATDIRKQQFVYNGPDYTDKKRKKYPKQAFLRPTNKFFDKYAHNVTRMGDRTWTNDEVYMRVAEMYLAKAEAQARQGKDAEAKTTLLELVSQRDTEAATIINPLSGRDLLDQIYFQWRIEMWGEGKGFWAMKRFQATNKRGSNSFKYGTQDFVYNAPELILEIPEDELNTNPHID